MRRSLQAASGLALALVLGLPASAEIALSLTPKTLGGWRVGISSGNLAGAPGSDLVPLASSATDEEILDLTGTSNLTAGWQVLAKRADGIWDEDLILQLEITSPGTGSGTISVPGQYLTMADTYQVFFSGSGDRQGISIRLRLGGISIPKVAAGKYTTSLVFTVVPK